MLNKILCKRVFVPSAFVFLLMVVLAGRTWSSDDYPTVPPPAALEVSIKIKNRQNAAGDILVVAGTGVEVEFTIKDPFGESRPQDIIQLRRPGHNEVVLEKQRGALLQGVSFLKLEGKDCPCKCGLIVEYLHA